MKAYKYTNYFNMCNILTSCVLALRVFRKIVTSLFYLNIT